MTTLIHDPRVTHSLSNLRNIGIAAHIDAGKTTLTERLLFSAGAIHHCGDVHDGNTTTDFSKLEQQKGITISAAVVPCSWTPRAESEIAKLFAGAPHALNVIDTPGHADFTVEVERSLRVLDGAIAVFCGVAGVQPQSETVWRQADRYRIPRLAFINKMDRVGANFDRVVGEIRERLGANAHPVLAPYGSEAELRGQIDLVNRRLVLSAKGRDGPRIERIPPEQHASSEALRSALVKELAEIDDEIAGAWLEGRDVRPGELHAAIRRQTIANRFVPIIAGSAYKFVGIQPLLDAVVQYLPAPGDLRSFEAQAADQSASQVESDPGGPLVALAFKLVSDRLAGRLVFVRVYRGVLRRGDSVWNPRARKTERIGRLVRVFADRRDDVERAIAGEICAVLGLREFTTGDTLCDRAHPVQLEPPHFPEAVIKVALEPQSGDDQQRLATALARLCDEDPTFRTFTDPETGQCIIAGMGELHLEVIRQKLELEHRVIAHTGPPEIAYRETITAAATADYLLKKQTGGPGMFARVVLAIEPTSAGSGIRIENQVAGGAIPAAFISAVERGIREATQNGILGGYPLVDLAVRILDGAAHAKDSNEMAFRLAAMEAMREAVRNARPALLEPIVRVECAVPAEFQGEILGDLNRRRGRILGVEARPGVNLVIAEAPLAEMFSYAGATLSLSRGRATHTMAPVRFDAVPAGIAENVLAQKKR